ncbi:hypothetical protein BGX34_010722 [Mortierella sp. NVP85]|nr:hypothetical protein BGX34_010722 [Mortierella sp. NVP85]
MPSPRPLELPEILSHIACYVPEHAIPVCARVSKAWFRAFAPIIWRDIKLDDRILDILDTSHNYSHLVKTLTVSTFRHSLDSLRCSNLQSLTLLEDPKSTELILNHPCISQLTLSEIPLLPELWSAMLQLHNLRDLELYNAIVLEEDADTFWQLCTRLERLIVSELTVTDRGQLLCMEFPRLKEVGVWRLSEGSDSLFLELLFRCPSLTTCRWTTNPSHDARFLPNFTQFIETKPWPDLHSLSIVLHSLSESDLQKVLIGMPRIISLELFCSLDNFTPDAMELLRPHFSNLRALQLRWSSDRASSPVAQEILSSCPLLERFSARVDARHVAEGKPWVCLGLKTLELCLRFDPSTIRHVQPLVFDQLARLTRLEALRLWDNMGVHGLTVTTFQEAVDLRLESGLGKLSTLRYLHTVDLGSSEQRMQEEEIVWMLEHWKSLEKIRGRFNFREPEVERALRERLRARNVEVSPDFYDDEDTSEDEGEDENHMVTQDEEDEEQTAVQDESQEDDEDSDDDDFYFDASEDGDDDREVSQDENLEAIWSQSQEDDDDSDDEEWWSS